MPKTPIIYLPERIKALQTAEVVSRMDDMLTLFGQEQTLLILASFIDSGKVNTAPQLLQLMNTALLGQYQFTKFETEMVFQAAKHRKPEWELCRVAKWADHRICYFYDPGDPEDRLNWGWFVTRTNQTYMFAKGSNLAGEEACKAVLRRWWDLLTLTDDRLLWI